MSRGDKTMKASHGYHLKCLHLWLGKEMANKVIAKIRKDKREVKLRAKDGL